MIRSISVSTMVAAMALASAAPAMAAPVPLPPVSYSFAGTCTLFCSGPVTGTLTLDNYAGWMDLANENIAGFSFTYDGITHELANFSDAAGWVDGADYFVRFDGWENDEYRWNVRIDSDDGSWSLNRYETMLLVGDKASLTAAVPEPASWALMIAGFGLAGTVLRRRRMQVAFG